MKQNKLVYIISPYSGEMDKNIAFAKDVCRYAVAQNCIPLAPHLLYIQIFDNSVPENRDAGIRMGLRVLEVCDELWVCGELSQDVLMETAYAKCLEVPVRNISEQDVKRWIVENQNGKRNVPEGVI